MNYIISIIPPEGLNILTELYKSRKLPMILTVPGSGTATQSMRELLGLATSEKRVVMTVASETQTADLILAHRRYLFIDTPGNGILISVPVKSVGGGKTLEFLNTADLGKLPSLNPDYELILVIANSGHTDTVMDAARSAGARGGTVLHAKGTGGKKDGKFFKVSIAQEKEVILIVASKADKANIMRSVMEQAGIQTEAGAITFSLPVTDVAGFGFREKEASV